MSAIKPIVIDDDASIDQEQIEEYEEMIESLGVFPDKVKINSLSMVAEDHAESGGSAKAIYETIRQRLVHASRDRILPLVYLVDSILKNAKGHYVQLVENDAANWIPTVYNGLQDQQREKLQKVWKTWQEFQIFSDASWKAMGRCFDEKISGNAIGSSTAQVAGISRTKDGTLLLPAFLRTEMQNILDDLQSNVTNELDKVSLERLADLNPDLLANIKNTAQDHQRSGKPSGNGFASLQHQSHPQDNISLPHFFTETRSQNALERSNEWNELKWDPLESGHDAVAKLLHRVRHDTTNHTLYTLPEAMEMTQHLATASLTASLLTVALERMKNQKDRQERKQSVSFPGLDEATRGAAVSSRGAHLDASAFTNDGIRQKNPAVISILYEIGLPFVSSADGRRFATQLELSNHLDALFKRNQLEKSMARTEERGWYISDIAWTGQTNDDETNLLDKAQVQGDQGALGDTDDPDTSTMPADETRDRCAICGINFKMFFDNDNGMYVYGNCRQIEVLNDDEVTLEESEDMLVHVTCWHGLGSPHVLTLEQTLQSAISR